MLTVKRQGFKYLLSYSPSTQKETCLYFPALATELYGNSEMGQVLLPGRADSWVANEKVAEILYIDLPLISLFTCVLYCTPFIWVEGFRSMAK